MVDYPLLTVIENHILPMILYENGRLPTWLESVASKHDFHRQSLENLLENSLISKKVFVPAHDYQNILNSFRCLSSIPTLASFLSQTLFVLLFFQIPLAYHPTQNILFVLPIHLEFGASHLPLHLDL